MTAAGARLRLTFPEDLITQPVIGRMMRAHDVVPNIRRASIDDTLGWMVCELVGEPGEVEAAVTWLVAQGVQVDRLGDVVES